jgi:phage N-6-adenine-methyltransferase
MSMPKQQPHKSRQDYETPDDLLRAIEAKYGPLEIDLAAREDNKKAPLCITPEQDSLKTPWPKGVLCWLNPPFSNIGEWAKKCRDEGASVIMLTPASVGSEWYAEYCHGNCRTVFIRPRLTFVGATDPYPKDCMLTLWNIDNRNAFELWRYK